MELQNRRRHEITLGATTYSFWTVFDEELWFWESDDVESTEGCFPTEGAAVKDAENEIRARHID